MPIDEQSDPSRPRQFASDNYAPICPEAWNAMAAANSGHYPSYGDDPWTAKAADQIREMFETDCEIYFVFTGTAANSLAISSMCQSYHSLLCHEVAHVECDECGAPEFFSNGTKVLLLRGENGKIHPPEIEQMVLRRTDIHYPKPRVVSVTQPTEVGTVYTPDELKAIREVADKHSLRLHMDGARFANAVASLGVRPKEITWQVGIEVLCLGGTKNGSGLGEIVVFFDRDLAAEFDFRCKQAGQLASKMRFISAPWTGLLADNAWHRHADHANRMAQRLEQGLRSLNARAVKILYPCEANSVFLDLPKTLADALHAKGWHFYSFIAGAGSRFMCSWDTTPEDVDALIQDIQSLI